MWLELAVLVTIFGISRLVLSALVTDPISATRMAGRQRGCMSDTFLVMGEAHAECVIRGDLVRGYLGLEFFDWP